MENISQNTKHTKSTLKMDGMAYIRAFTTIWNTKNINSLPIHVRAIKLIEMMKDSAWTSSHFIKFEFHQTWKLQVRTQDEFKENKFFQF